MVQDHDSRRLVPCHMVKWVLGLYQQQEGYSVGHMLRQWSLSWRLCCTNIQEVANLCYGVGMYVRKGCWWFWSTWEVAAGVWWPSSIRIKSSVVPYMPSIKICQRREGWWYFRRMGHLLIKQRVPVSGFSATALNHSHTLLPLLTSTWSNHSGRYWSTTSGHGHTLWQVWLSSRLLFARLGIRSPWRASIAMWTIWRTELPLFWLLVGGIPCIR